MSWSSYSLTDCVTATTEMANMIGEVRGIEYAPIKFEIADDLSYWSAEIPGKVLAKAEALTGPTTPPGKRYKLLTHLEVR